MKIHPAFSRAALVLPLLASFAAAEEQPWISLFNGKNLDGWTPKIAKHPLGENFANTFRVEDGILKASYDGYEKFDGQFGHLFSNISYSHYILRLEYRFMGTKVPDAPAWTNFNSGVMIHTQPPTSISVPQEFPVSLEFQFLADEGKGKRQTGNLCTPGTNVEIDGKLVTQHIVDSSAPTFAPETWVKAEVEVHGSDEIIHRINGVEVLRFQHPQLDPRGEMAPSQELLKLGAAKLLASGHFALQAEGHPVWFRNIELKSLEKP